MISSSYNVIQSVAKDLKSVGLCLQILRHYVPLNDKAEMDEWQRRENT